jgi:GT2 family glycosyltransferase
VVSRYPSDPEQLSESKPGKIGVVTVTYNSAEVLPEFFDSLAVQTYSDFIVYVVDNASKDATLEICRRREDVPIFLIPNDKNLGVAEGNNQGIRAAVKAGCEYILLLNNDTVFDGNLLSELRAGLVRHKCAMTTPKILYYDDPGKIWAAGGYFQQWLGYRAQHYGEGKQDRGQFNQSRPITYAPTCCVLVHKDAFSRIGLMDAQYFVYSDDTDFMYRAMKAGLILQYLPSCTVLHKVSSLTGGTSLFSIKYCTRNRIYFMRKHLSGISAAFWITQYWVYLCLRYVIRKDPKPIWICKRQAAIEGMRLDLGAPVGWSVSRET